MTMVKTEDLFNPKDIARIRALLIKEQDKLCAITGIPTKPEDYHLDHAHDTEQLVRGAVNKNANMLIGKIENLQVRYLNHWYPHGLPAFLRACADYLDKPKDRRYRHSGWLKKAMVNFNKLKVQQQNNVLKSLGQPSGSNLTERRKLFSKALLTKQFSYDTIMNLLNKG